MARDRNPLPPEDASAVPLGDVSFLLSESTDEGPSVSQSDAAVGGGGAPAGDQRRRRRTGLLNSAKHLVTVDLQLDDDEPPIGTGSHAAISDKEVTPLVHLFRGEVGRLTAYRQRMDMTTNWAVSMTGVLVAFSLGSKDTPHFFFAFITMLQFFFCFVEARRHAFYVLVRHRCRLMERGMYAHILEPGLPALDWRRPLRHSYMPDTKLVPLYKSFMLRLKRIYVYLVLATYMGWSFKLMTLAEPTGFPWIVFASVSAVVLIFATWVFLFIQDNSVDV